jgi:type IV pilus assembly protein PilY1
MIHAVNAGFYDEINKRFCRKADCTDEGATPATSPELGAELWAYVPYNLLPHLKCLTESDYEHKYFVDKQPRIFDVRIFVDDIASDPIHVGGWGTILVQGMRFGGAKVRPGELDLDNNTVADYPADKREFTSTYVIFDITNPEYPPILLAELTRKTDASHVDLAYTTATPSLVVMKNGDDVGDMGWYLLLGSGPTEIDGKSTQAAKLAVFPMNWLVEGARKAFRITDTLPTVATDQIGAFTLSDDSFIPELISVDFELEENYKTDAVYFGTVSNTWGSWGGGLYRLVTRKLDTTTGNQVVTRPSEWSTLLNASSLTNPLYLINTEQPVTGAASIGTDGVNYWIYFGTGRFYDEDDKTDSSSNDQQAFYGIKEPRDCDGFTWETVEKTGAWDTVPGSQGLLQVDKIQVRLAPTGTLSVFSCKDSDPDCEALRSSGITTFDGLDKYIAGTGGCYDSTDSVADRDLYETGTDGWYKEFYKPRERNLGQATLLGGLLTFTTYQPFNDVCLPEGLAYLYGVYFRTGTAWYKSVFGDPEEGEEYSEDVLILGRGLAITPNLHVGKQEGSKAFVQTSTGTIVEIPQPNLPLGNFKTGRSSWSEMK